jgi:hypothetical protein
MSVTLSISLEEADVLADILWRHRHELDHSMLLTAWWLQPRPGEAGATQGEQRAAELLALANATPSERRPANVPPVPPSESVDLQGDQG